MSAVPPSKHFPQEPYVPAQDWVDPVPTTLTCGCGLVFSGPNLLDAVALFSAHQYEVVPVGTLMDASSRPIPPGELCEFCEVRQATRVLMGPVGPVTSCPDPLCGRFSRAHLGRLPADIWA